MNNEDSLPLRCVSRGERRGPPPPPPLPSSATCTWERGSGGWGEGGREGLFWKVTLTWRGGQGLDTLTGYFGAHGQGQVTEAAR